MQFSNHTLRSALGWTCFVLGAIVVPILLFFYLRAEPSGVRYLPMDEYNAGHTDIDRTEIAPASEATTPDAALYTLMHASDSAYAAAAKIEAEHPDGIARVMAHIGPQIVAACTKNGELWQTIAQTRDSGTGYTLARATLMGRLEVPNAPDNATKELRRLLYLQGLSSVYYVYPDQSPSFFYALGKSQCLRLYPAAMYHEATAKGLL